MFEFIYTSLELPHYGDKWMMMECLRYIFSAEELRRLNGIRIHMQVLFLSEILSASGKIMDGKYLVGCKTDEKWSKLNFAEKQSPNNDFTLWKAAIRQVVPAGGIMGQLGNLNQDGHRIWD